MKIKINSQQTATNDDRLRVVGSEVTRLMKAMKSVNYRSLALNLLMTVAQFSILAVIWQNGSPSLYVRNGDISGGKKLLF